MPQRSSDELPKNPLHDYPKALDAHKLISALEARIIANESDRDSAVNAGWFDKAAKIESINEGIKLALRAIKKGDFYLN